MWWSVSNPANSFASIEVVADNAEEAIASAILPGNYPDWARVKNTLKATPIRPYEAPKAKEPAAQGQGSGNWGIWIGASQRFARQPNTIIDDNVLRRFPSQQAAEQFLARTREENPRMRTDVEVREIEPAQPPAVPQGGNTGNWGVWVPSLDRYATIGNAGARRFDTEADAQAWIQDYNARHSGNDIGLVAREVATAQPQAATQDNWSQDFERRMSPDAAPQAQQQWTGEWKIVDANDREIHRFGGVGNVQADANRIAIDWLRQNPRHMQSGVQVLPVMG